MFKDLDIPSIQQRCKELRLSFLFKITQGQVQAIPADAYLEPSKAKRRIAPKIFDNRETKNLVSKYVTNRSRCFKIPSNQESGRTIQTILFSKNGCRLEQAVGQ